MAELVLETKKRTEIGKRAAQRLRKQGLLPVVLYGHGEETLSFSLPLHAVETAVRHGVHVLNLDTDGTTQKALIRDIQWDFLGKDILHLDLYRIREGERVEVTVPIEIRGIAPGASAGGILEQPMHQLHIECPADAIPETIRVSVAALQLEQAIHVKDLTLPEGVQALADGDALVVHVVAKQVEEEAPVAPVAEGAAEPERIVRQKPAEETEK